jgi:hypothetical protein
MVRPWKATALGAGGAQGRQKTRAFSYSSIVNRRAPSSRIVIGESAICEQCTRSHKNDSFTRSKRMMLPVLVFDPVFLPAPR